MVFMTPNRNLFFSICSFQSVIMFHLNKIIYIPYNIRTSKIIFGNTSQKCFQYAFIYTYMCVYIHVYIVIITFRFLNNQKMFSQIENKLIIKILYIDMLHVCLLVCLMNDSSCSRMLSVMRAGYIPQLIRVSGVYYKLIKYLWNK